MPPLKMPKSTNLADKLHKAVSARRKLAEGIANHSEKEKARREAENRKRELAKPLKQVPDDSTTSLPAIGS